MKLSKKELIKWSIIFGIILVVVVAGYFLLRTFAAGELTSTLPKFQVQPNDAFQLSNTKIENSTITLDGLGQKQAVYTKVKELYLGWETNPEHPEKEWYMNYNNVRTPIGASAESKAGAINRLNTAGQPGIQTIYTKSTTLKAENRLLVKLAPVNIPFPATSYVIDDVVVNVYQNMNEAQIGIGRTSQEADDEGQPNKLNNGCDSVQGFKCTRIFSEIIAGVPWTANDLGTLNLAIRPAFDNTTDITEYDLESVQIAVNYHLIGDSLKRGIAKPVADVNYLADAGFNGAEWRQIMIDGSVSLPQTPAKTYAKIQWFASDNAADLANYKDLTTVTTCVGKCSPIIELTNNMLSTVKDLKNNTTNPYPKGRYGMFILALATENLSTKPSVYNLIQGYFVPNATPICPAITSFAPLETFAGGPVTINGSNLVGATAYIKNSVTNGDLKYLTILPSSTATQIQATLPPDVPASVTGVGYNIFIQKTGCTTVQKGILKVKTAPTLCPPQITDFTPTLIGPSELLTINGQNFGANQGAGSTLSYAFIRLSNAPPTDGGQSLEINSWSNSIIKANVPANVVPGGQYNVYVKNSTCTGDPAKSTGLLTIKGTPVVCQNPTITGFTPATPVVDPGGNFSINGNYFSNLTTAKLKVTDTSAEEYPLTVNAVSATLLNATVSATTPAGAYYVFLTNPNCATAVKSPTQIKVNPVAGVCPNSPKIISADHDNDKKPVNHPPLNSGTLVTLEGLNFGNVQGQSIIQMFLTRNNKPYSIKAKTWSDSKITFNVPVISSKDWGGIPDEAWFQLPDWLKALLENINFPGFKGVETISVKSQLVYFQVTNPKCLPATKSTDVNYKKISAKILFTTIEVPWQFP